MRPILDRIIVRRNEIVKTSEIVTPDQFLEAPVEGTVIAVPTMFLIGTRDFLPSEIGINVGNVVRFGDMNAETFKDDDGKELLIVRIQDVRYVR